MNEVTQKLYKELCMAIKTSYANFADSGLSAEAAILGTMSEIGLRFNMADNTFDPELFIDDCKLRKEHDEDLQQ